VLQITISKRSALILAVALLLVIPLAAYAGTVFDDVDDTSTHIDGITFMKDSGVSVGCDASNNYCPGDNVTRAQMGTFMYRLSGNDPATDPSVNAAELDGYSVEDLVVDRFGVATGTNATTTSSNTYVDLAGASTTVDIPAGHEGTIVVTFSGESACYGGSGWCGVKVLIDGVEANPSVTGGTSVFEFAFDSTDGDTETSSSWESHAIQRSSDTLTAGSHTVTVQYGVFGTASFRIDDWQLTAQALLSS